LVQADPALPFIPANVFNVTNYGAIPNGGKDNTTNIQNTIAAAEMAGGGTVEIPAGAFLSGQINLSNSIRLQVDTNALLQMLPYGAYPGSSGEFTWKSAAAAQLTDKALPGGRLMPLTASWHAPCCLTFIPATAFSFTTLLFKTPRTTTVALETMGATSPSAISRKARLRPRPIPTDSISSAPIA
jgi:hypothetical protein